jgi:hypothetical protein
LGRLTISVDVAGDPDFSTQLVPAEARMPKLQLTMAWWALCSAMFYLIVAATLALTFGARNAVAGLSGAVLLFALVNGLISRFAIRTGSSVALFSTLMFGRQGAALATVILTLTAMYFAVFEGSVVAMAFEVAGHIPRWVAYLLVVLYSTPLVFGGVARWMDKLNGVLLPLYVVGLATAIGLTLARYGYSNDWLSLGPRGDQLDGRWWSCFAAYLGVWVIMMFTWDYARFGRVRDQGYHGLFNFGLPFYLVTFFLNGVIGIFLVATLGRGQVLSETSIVTVLVKLMGMWGVLFIWVTQTRINTANFQVATVNLQNLARQVAIPISKVLAAILVGVGVFAAMLTDVFSFILQALRYQGVFVVAWVAMALAFILIRGPALGSREEMNTALATQRAADHTAVAIWLAASGLGLATLRFAPDWAAVVSAIFAAGAYALSLFQTRRREAREPRVA